MFSMSWMLYIQQSKTLFEKIKFRLLICQNICTYNIYIFGFLFLLWNDVLYLQLNHYAKFSLAHNLVSFYKSFGCFIVHHCLWKPQLVRTSTWWKNTEYIRYSGVLKRAVAERQWRTFVKQKVHMQKLRGAKKVWILQEWSLQTEYFKLPLIKQSEIQSPLKKGLTLA